MRFVLVSAAVVTGLSASSALAQSTPAGPEERDATYVTGFEWTLGVPVSGVVGAIATGLAVNVLATEGDCHDRAGGDCVGTVSHSTFTLVSHGILGGIGLFLVGHALWALFEWEIRPDPAREPVRVTLGVTGGGPTLGLHLRY
jgi:hypothetical protein